MIGPSAPLPTQVRQPPRLRAQLLRLQKPTSSSQPAASQPASSGSQRRQPAGLLAAGALIRSLPPRLAARSSPACPPCTGEKARRRDPRVFTYTGIACPDFRKVREAARRRLRLPTATARRSARRFACWPCGALV
jgi:hypothetical protein